jgi:hypothetical protein
VSRYHQPPSYVPTVAEEVPDAIFDYGELPVEEEDQEAPAVFAPPRVRSRGRMKASRMKSPIESPGARKKKRKASDPVPCAPTRRSRRCAASTEAAKCRTCNSVEHFANKCPLNTVPNPVGSSSRKCTSCGCTGHNKSTCGRKSSYGSHKD